MREWGDPDLDLFAGGEGRGGDDQCREQCECDFFHDFLLSFLFFVLVVIRDFGARGAEDHLIFYPTPPPLPDLLVDVISGVLDHLNDHDQDRDGVDHDVRLKAVVAVFYRQVAESAAADDARHRGVAEEVYRDYRPVEDYRGHRLFDHHAEDYLCGGGPEGSRRLDDAAVDLEQAALHEARDEWGRRDRQRYDRGGAADRGAGDKARQRDYRDQQDDEGEGAQQVHRHVEHAVDGLVRLQSVGARYYHQDRHAGAEYPREEGRHRHHV
ncbi:hypothetical protein SDC9_149039 [bioreactor metagenome]|uniref:Uncharacterized protein n=1 Tax=bioreactor metagenome TaxID=1076179 RepID=A0A645EJ96_9ZZZZ